jgi:hypothetical protein
VRKLGREMTSSKSAPDKPSRSIEPPTTKTAAMAATIQARMFRK